MENSLCYKLKNGTKSISGLNRKFIIKMTFGETQMNSADLTYRRTSPIFKEDRNIRFYRVFNVGLVLKSIYNLKFFGTGF